MSFRIEGGGAVGGGSAIVTMRSKNFRNISPSATEFFQVWDPADPVLPEPDLCHVMVTTRLPYMDALSSNNVGCCGAAFGYKIFRKGNIPQKLFAWRGAGGPSSLPYTYSRNQDFSGFNDSTSRTNAYELPLAAVQSAMNGRNDYLPPDAENNYRGVWDTVFNGGRGAKNTSNFVGGGGGGANGTIFGRGGNANLIYGGGTGGNATATARGPAAVAMHEKVFKNWSPIFKSFIKGDDSEAPSDRYGASGKAKFVVPTGNFILASGPTNIETAGVVLPEPAWPPPSTIINDDVMNFVVLCEYY